MKSDSRDNGSTPSRVYMNIGVWGFGSLVISVLEQGAGDDYADIVWMHEAPWLASRYSHMIEQVVREILRKRGSMILTYKGLRYDPDHSKWRYYSGNTKKRLTFESYNTKIAVLSERGSLCWYCGERKATTLDHFKPLSRGGSPGLDNLVPSCRVCNESKGSEDPRVWLGDKKYEDVLERISRQMTMSNFYCSDPNDEELFNVVTALFSKCPSVTIMPGVVSKAVARQQRAAALSNPDVLRYLSGHQPLNIAMTHPIEKVRVSSETDITRADLPSMVEHC